MKKDELRQTMMVCITTLEKLNGHEPSAEELSMALGMEYETVLAEYLTGCRIMRAA